MAASIDELTVNYVEEGQLVSKELAKVVLTKGAWCTIMYKFQEWDRKNEAYGPDKYTIRRYQKKGGEYQQRSKFNISNREQAEKIISVLSGWINES